MHDLTRATGRAVDVVVGFVSGGSRDWAEKLMHALALTDEFTGSVRLYDLDDESAQANAELGREIQRRDAGVTELAETLGHSKSTVHSHLRTPEAQRIVVREGDGYRLGLRLLDMATHVRNQMGNYDVIREEMDTLADETGEIAQFGIEEHGQVSYRYKRADERVVETASRVGTQQPMHTTALGKTILASLPDDRACEIVQAQRYEAKTPTTIPSAEALAAELDTIRERGYGIDDEENIEGLRCVAAPVTSDETVLGAVSVTGPASRVTHDRIHDELADEARRAANVIALDTKFA